MIAFKFRLYPNKKQQDKLWLHANKLNQVYNQFLNEKIETYKKHGFNISRYDLNSQLPWMKCEDSILKNINAKVIQQITLRLDNTYKAFFKHFKDGQGFPKFRSCKNFFGICYPQSGRGYSIQNDIFITKVYGNIKFKNHREIIGNIKTATIICDKNKWFLCVITDFEKGKTGLDIIGLDVGITNIIATSQGDIIRNKTHAKYFDKQIDKLKSRRDKCKKYSRKHKFLNQVVQRLYGVKSRKIDDFQHKVSKNLSSKYDTIVIEDLNLKQMSEGKITGLNRELRNSKLASFIYKLKYKTNKIIEVNPKNTSKICNNCGKLHDMPLNKREYICSCGYKEDRDVNAAKNILCLGQAILLKVRAVDTNLQKVLSK